MKVYDSLVVSGQTGSQNTLVLNVSSVTAYFTTLISDAAGANGNIHFIGITGGSGDSVVVSAGRENSTGSGGTLYLSGGSTVDAIATAGSVVIDAGTVPGGLGIVAIGTINPAFINVGYASSVINIYSNTTVSSGVNLTLSSTSNLYNYGKTNINGTLTKTSTVYIDGATSGGSYTIGNLEYGVIVNPTSSVIATYTVTMPPDPVDGQEVMISTGVFGVTTFTLSPNSGQTFALQPVTTTLVNGGRSLTYQWRSSNSSWYRTDQG